MYRYLVFKTIVILVGGAASLVKESPSLCSMESPMAEGGVANPHGGKSARLLETEYRE